MFYIGVVLLEQRLKGFTLEPNELLTVIKATQAESNERTEKVVEEKMRGMFAEMIPQGKYIQSFLI